nr:MAG TPA: hypothetical protein [Caudoviricetes sp.]
MSSRERIIDDTTSYRSHKTSNLMKKQEFLPPPPPF